MVKFGQNNNRKSMLIITGPARVRALSHVVNVLSYGNFLCDYIKAKVDFYTGNFLSIDPAGRCLDKIEDFSLGVGMGCDDGIAERLFTSLTLILNRFVVFDDVMGEVSNRDLGDFVEDGQIYHVISRNGITSEKLSHMIWASSVSWHFLGVIFHRKTMIELPQVIVDRSYVDFGEIVEVIVGAYDGEGFIHWRPD